MKVSEKYQNKYRIESTRLKDWDYGWDGAYFVTICTQNREQFFGEIQDGIMQLSAIGQLADKFWQEIPAHFPFIELDEYVPLDERTILTDTSLPKPIFLTLYWLCGISETELSWVISNSFPLIFSNCSNFGTSITERTFANTFRLDGIANIVINDIVKAIIYLK